MKSLTILPLVIMSFLSSSVVMAAQVKRIDVFPPFLKVVCSKSEPGTISSLGLRLKKMSSAETENEITLSLQHELLLCTNELDQNNQKVLTWKKVDPFKGFDVPYYDFSTNQLKLRKEIILSEVKANKFEVGVYSFENHLGKKTRMSSLEDGSFTGTLTINKNELLDQNDLDLLNQGTEVKKVIELFEVSNMSTIVAGNTMEAEDTPWSGRNIAIIFIKENNQIRVKNISL